MSNDDQSFEELSKPSTVRYSKNSENSIVSKVCSDTRISKNLESEPRLSFLLPGWKQLLHEEFSMAYMEKIRVFLREEYRQNKTVFPNKENFFKAFSLTDFDDVNVVVLGQDPYHNVGQALGLSFAVGKHTPEPPSLKNIFAEIESDIALRSFSQRAGATCDVAGRKTLSHWVNQGVFLLNSVLSVRAHEPFSHRNIGWEIFTNKAIELLGARKKPLVFMLWGAPAQKKQSLIQNPNHLVLTAPHPSPLSAYRGFFGCKHFSKANEFLAKNSLKPISWL